MGDLDQESLGKLEAPDDLMDQLDRQRFQALAVSIAHALAAGALPRLHHDLFDRI